MEVGLDIDGVVVGRSVTFEAVETVEMENVFEAVEVGEVVEVEGVVEDSGALEVGGAVEAGKAVEGKAEGVIVEGVLEVSWLVALGETVAEANWVVGVALVEGAWVAEDVAAKVEVAGTVEVSVLGRAVA